MPAPPINKLLIAAIVMLCALALLFTTLASGFGNDNSLVYQGF